MKKIILLLLTLATSVAVWASDPYYEVVSGSLSDYTITLKVTFPDATTVDPYFMTNYSANLYDKNHLLMAFKRNNNGVKVDGNSFTLPLDVFNHSDNMDDLSLVLEKFSLKVDGNFVTTDLTIYPKKVESAEPTYFWVKNISGSNANMLLFPDMNIEYTKDPEGGEWSAVTRYWTVVLANDEKVYLRAASSDEIKNVLRPYSAEFDYAIGGDITTLLVPEGNLLELPEIIDGRAVFSGLFWGENYLVDASELALTSTKLAPFCYDGMFYECPNLTAAPVLTALELAPFCYASMFMGCSKLNHVKAYFTDWGTPDDMCTMNWLLNTAPEGTFEGHAWVAYNPTGNIPLGWTPEPFASMDITVPEAGYTTFYYEQNWVMPEGMEGYIAIYDYDYRTASYEFVFQKVFEAGDVVPSQQALVLKAKAGTYTINFTEDAPKDFFGSDLGGSVVRTDLADEFYFNHTDFYWYALSLDENGENVGFYWVEDDGAAYSNAPFNVWFRVSRYYFPDGAKSSFCFADTEADAIDAVVASSRNVDGSIYDLSGRRLNTPVKGGLYIINGKKVLK